jgi:hypothetical protein
MSGSDSRNGALSQCRYSNYCLQSSMEYEYSAARTALVLLEASYLACANFPSRLQKVI